MTTPEPADARRPADPASELTARDADILAFEHTWSRHAGAKEEAIRLQFGLSVVRYYQVLNSLIDSPAAIAHDPILTRRLRRVRDARVAARAARGGSRSSIVPGRADD
ncbi:DUF3263 domain-containing protein [Marisediminicola sp. LYQ134]|uniref:DUF3263 domain-containing protein n=1 Tax=unclassified Marisediminicola TaxID=2618316 RepID=UPI0039836805